MGLTLINPFAADYEYEVLGECRLHDAKQGWDHTITLRNLPLTATSRCWETGRNYHLRHVEGDDFIMLGSVPISFSVSDAAAAETLIASMKPEGDHGARYEFDALIAMMTRSPKIYRQVHDAVNRIRLEASREAEANDGDPK